MGKYFGAVASGLDQKVRSGIFFNSSSDIQYLFPAIPFSELIKKTQAIIIHDVVDLSGF